MSFCKLPNEVILKIFKLFSLQEQIQLRGVNARWCVLIDDLCQQRQSLKIFGSFRCVEILCTDIVKSEANAQWALKDLGQDDDLILDLFNFSGPLCKLLVRLFPNVRHLVFCVDQYQCSIISDLTYMLNKLSCKLVSLSLFDLASAMNGVPSFHDCIVLDVIITAPLVIHQMSSLKRLDLYAQHNCKKYSPLQVLNLLSPILSQLKSVSLPAPIWSVHNRYAHEDKLVLTQLRLDFPVDFYRGLMSNEILVNNFNGKLTRLSLIGIDYRFFYDIGWSTFTSLKYLCITFVSSSYDANNSLDKVFHRLSSLKKLIELELSVESQTFKNLAMPPVGRKQFNRVKKLTLADVVLKGCVFKGESFCRFVSTWFRRLEHLNVSTGSGLVKNQIEHHLNLFPRLKHDQLKEYPTRHIGRHIKRFTRK